MTWPFSASLMIRRCCSPSSLQFVQANLNFYFYHFRTSLSWHRSCLCPHPKTYPSSYLHDTFPHYVITDWQPFRVSSSIHTQGSFSPVEEGLTAAYTVNFRTRWNTRFYASPDLAFTIRDKTNGRFVYTIVVTDCSDHFTCRIPPRSVTLLFLSINSPSACTSSIPDIFKNGVTYSLTTFYAVKYLGHCRSQIILRRWSVDHTEWLVRENVTLCVLLRRSDHE